MCQYETLLSFSSPLFDAAWRWSGGQTKSSKGSHLNQPLTLGSLRVEAILPSTAELYRSHQKRQTHSSGVRWFSSPAFTSAAQYSVITCGTKKAKTQADFSDELPRIRGLYLGSSWEEAGGADAKVTT